MFDNQSMYNAIDYQLQIEIVDYQHLNNLVAQVISSYTGLRKFNNCDNSKFFSNLCPYPRMHHLIPSYGKMTLINELHQNRIIANVIHSISNQKGMLTLSKSAQSSSYIYRIIIQVKIIELFLWLI
ncbi:unnamed protein product [Paramecium octaurelia]|uniref:Uncharacterized protein n=1 Tax=Paramecium octaurelia TaxID=43137 RepID=A0A8S1YKX6_PAROT|nr:unnamed protein product [Paramecium octaurelia]